MIAIVDYGVGNLYSLAASLSQSGQPCVVTRDPALILAADKVILPGVGAFADAIGKLRETGLVPVLDRIVREGKPLLGICLGMQLLFEKSLEYGEHKGLCYLPGTVSPLADDLPMGLKVPHIGWNALNVLDANEPMLLGLSSGAHVYYVHSYYVKGAGDCVKAVSEYGVDVPGVVRHGSVSGTQFHPEKSGAVGLSILSGFAETR